MKIGERTNLRSLRGRTRRAVIASPIRHVRQMDKLLGSIVVTTMVVEDVTGKSPSFTLGDRPFVTMDPGWEPEVAEADEGIATIPMRKWSDIRQIEDGIARIYLMVSDAEKGVRRCYSVRDALKAVRKEMRLRELLLSSIFVHPDRESDALAIADLGVTVASSDSVPMDTVIGVAQPRDVGVVAYSRQTRKAGVAFYNPLAIVSVRLIDPPTN